jgi:hypothetical protein
MKKEELEKEAQTSSTQPEYQDESGKVFTAADIVSKGFKPKGRFRGHSLSKRVTSPGFGSVKRKD